MKNKRYNEINHKDVKTIDDIDKIVDNEVKLDEERGEALKDGMISATAWSIISKIIIIFISLIFVAIVFYISIIAYVFFANSQVRTVSEIKKFQYLPKENLK